MCPGSRTTVVHSGLVDVHATIGCFLTPSTACWKGLDWFLLLAWSFVCEHASGADQTHRVILCPEIWYGDGNMTNAFCNGQAALEECKRKLEVESQNNQFREQKVVTLLEQMKDTASLRICRLHLTGCGGRLSILL
eukprot:4504628-Amphidinium_carterae.1